MAKHAPVQRAVPQTAAIVAICAVLVGITWFIFGQTLRHQFVTYDDPQYVYANPDISAGISLPRIFWAFTHTIAGNWHPLTTISHMLDCQLYGLDPAGHHFTNVLFHTIAVVLLFLVLQQMTGSLWRSAFVAALFAIHPLHVESVAWVSERKDVLSAVFFMLTLGAYIRFVRAPSFTAYILVLLFFALGLMSKPMLVSVPFVLLLLDYWPLGRITHVGSPKALKRQPASNSQWPVIRRLVAEKVPLFALSAFSSAVTLFTQFQSTGTMSQLPLPWRLNNAAVSYIVYIWQMFWPVRLAAFYPHPNDQLRLWQVLLAIAFLIAVTLLVIHWRNGRPYIFTGWFWYIGMLVPVIGLLEAGEQGRADRYTYLPQIGLYVLITWGIADLILSITAGNSAWRIVTTASRPASFRSHKTRTGSSAAPSYSRRDDQNRSYQAICAAIATVIIISLSWRAFVQTSYWKDSEALWNHTLTVTSDNDVAHYNLGYLYLQRGDMDSAISHFETALQIRSRNTATHYNFGGAPIENNLANLLAQKGRLNEAVDHYHNAMRLRPGYGDPYLNLGNVLFQQGRMSDAMAQWQKAHATESKDARFHTALGDAFRRAGLQKDAVAEYEYAVRISAQDPLPRNNLAWILATSSDASIRDGNRAVELADEAVRLSHGKDPNCLRTLAAACAESGRFAEAEETARRAFRAADLLHNRGLVNALRDEIALYELGLPYHR
jgi:tetratricopeptide (TPR) repeat protein